MIDKFNKMDNSKKVPIFISIAVILIILVIVFSQFFNNTSSYSDLKEDKNKGFVYTLKSEKNSIYFKKIPYLNINNSFGKEINNDINSFVSDFIDNDKVILSYEYDINGKVLSIVLKCVDYDVKNVPKVYFKTYNINLETSKLLSDEELLSIYNVTSLDVESIIEKKFEYWYKDLVKEGYIDEEECDYDCFLNYREVDDYLDDVVYYIEKGNLVLYKPFVFYSIFGEENYFKEEDFKFIISE